MDASAPQNAFAPVIAFLTDHVRLRLAEDIARQAGLDDVERLLVAKVAERALLDNAERKLNRVLLLELHAAKLSGDLPEGTEASRFAAFVAQAMTPGFIAAIDRRYPAADTSPHEGAGPAAPCHRHHAFSAGRRP